MTLMIRKVQNGKCKAENAAYCIYHPTSKALFTHTLQHKQKCWRFINECLNVQEPSPTTLPPCRMFYTVVTRRREYVYTEPSV